jgi:hypothetical protein
LFSKVGLLIHLAEYVINQQFLVKYFLNCFIIVIVVVAVGATAAAVVVVIVVVVVVVIGCTFGNVNWRLEELQKLDGKTRTLLTIHGQRYLKADVDGSYVPRNQGRRVLMQVEETYKVEIT